MTCEYGEAHEAHMALNGECPWCGASDESAVNDDALRELLGEVEYDALRAAERR